MKTFAEKCIAKAIIPVRYSVPKGTIEFKYCHDLLLAEDGEKWKEAIDLCILATNVTLHDFWTSVREEYFKHGGRMGENSEVVIEDEIE